MAGQEEKVAWESVDLQQANSPGYDLEKSVQTPNRLHEVSSTAIRSVKQSFGRVSASSARVYKHTWPKVSSVSVRLYTGAWPKVRSKTVCIYRRVSPKLSSASDRIYRRAWPKGSSTAIRGESLETSAAGVRLPQGDRLEFASMALRLLQLASALYVLLCVTESFRSKITYDGRVRQIQPLMLTTLIYASVSMICFLLLNLVKKLRSSVWRITAMTSVPGDISMVCLFFAKDVILGVHSFECAAAHGSANVVRPYGDVENTDSLELRSHYNDRLSHGVLIASARDVCLVPSSVYVVCIVAALSYLGSVTITIRQLMVHRKCVATVVDGRYPGHVEQVLPDTVSRQPQMTQRGRSIYGNAPPRSAMTGFEVSRSCAPVLPRPGPASEDPKYANLPEGLLESMVVDHLRTPPERASSVPTRTSYETTSSMDPDQYVVSDGFRPCGRPPSYTSSRESSQGPPEYRSRPPSLHTVVLTGP